MIRFVFSILAASLLLATPARAQDQDTQPLLDQFFSLINASGRGFAVADYLLRDSFAHAVFGDAPIATVAELSLRRVNYDASADPAMLAGTAYYHLSEPISLLRQVGSGWEEVLPRILEIRMMWLAGRPDLALAWAEKTISEIEEAEWEDKYMTSILADAAVMAYRAGRTEQAEAWFARAQSCTAGCPDDVAIFFLQNSLSEAKVSNDSFDPASHREAAVEAVSRDLPDTPLVGEALELEHDLMSGNATRAVRKALRGTQNPGDMTANEKQLARYIALRLIREEGLWRQADDLSSNASLLRAVAGSENSPEAIPVSALQLKPWWRASYRETSLLRLLPVVSQLLSASETPADQFVARLFQTWVISLFDEAKGRDAMISLLADARGQGFDTPELIMLVGDLTYFTHDAGDTAEAERLAAEANSCFIRVCTEDIYFSISQASADLPTFPRPGGHVDVLIEFADPLIRQWVPDNPAFLSQLYFSGRLQDRPLDGARRDRIAISLLEADPTIGLPYLVGKAEDVIDTLLYAGFYAEALDLGDRIAARDGFSDLPSVQTAAFRVGHARAAFRLGEGRAEELYRRAIADVTAAGNQDEYRPRLGERLATELLDTPFLDLTEAYYTTWDPDRTTTFTARLLARQGKPGEAARVIRAQRRSVEIAGGSAALPDVYTQAAANALSVRNLDLYADMITRSQRVADGVDIPPDHPALYTQYYDLKALAWQEATYLDAAGDPTEAARIRALGGYPTWFHGTWAALPDRPGTDALAEFERRKRNTHKTSYDAIRHIIEIRDIGNYEAAAQYMSNYGWVAEAAEANGAYVDAQTLWQMAFTFARVGETGPAFDLMNRAARIAATLSFEGAGGANGGTLQLLERDRWRYLLFVDIAWAAVSGQVPEDLSVVSTY